MAKLPDKIYLLNSEDCYYSLENEVPSVEKTVPDRFCEVVVEYINPEEFYLRACNGAYFQYHPKKGGHIVHKITKKSQEQAIKFIVLDLEEKDTFVFRSSNGKFMVLEVNEKQRIGLGSFENATIKVGKPSIKSLVSNFVYDLESSVITDLTPEIALTTAVRNDSTMTSTQNLTYAYHITHVGSWTNKIGVSLPSQSKVPCLVDGKILIAENYSHAGVASKVETKTASSYVAVPAQTRGVATVLIYRAIIKTPGTYEQRDWYRSGGFETRRKDFVYSNTITYGVDVELTDLISITHDIGT